MARNKRSEGRVYEDAVASAMEKKKYRILEKNFFANRTEIDIIAAKGDTVVFVEVKARKEGSGFNPLEAVGRVKQRRIITAAKKYINSKRLFKNYVRFDVAGVIFSGDKIVKLDLVQDAFQDG